MINSKELVEAWGRGGGGADEVGLILNRNQGPTEKKIWGVNGLLNG